MLFRCKERIEDLLNNPLRDTAAKVFNGKRYAIFFMDTPGFAAGFFNDIRYIHRRIRLLNPLREIDKTCPVFEGTLIRLRLKPAG